MLYVTTRDISDAYTAHRTLLSDRGPDGGLYLPFRMPQMDPDELSALAGKGFGLCVSEMLNQFFSCRLTGWDVELCAGRYPLRASSLNRKILVGESWHNLQWNYQHLESALSDLICRSISSQTCVTSWMKIAIRIAVLFALYAEMLKKELIKLEQNFDVAVPTGDFALAIAVAYARQMGMPVSTLVCACDENSPLWELVNHGELRPDSQKGNTAALPSEYAFHPELERLIHLSLGREEALRFGQCCTGKSTYVLRPDMLSNLRKGLSVAVVSTDRVSALISSEYATSGYVLGPDAALAYGALIDYRARTGESRPAVILSDRCPICDSEFVSGTLRVTNEELNRLVQKG